MSRIVWRIGSDTSTYEADDLSGAGAKKSGARWNDVGLAVTYCASNISLACLETVVHLNAGGLPFNRYLVAVEIPDDIFAAAQVHTPSSIKLGWEAQPAGLVSIQLGSDWIRSKASALLIVPSAIVPEESNILINPEHPSAAKITAKKVRRWLYDPRIR